MRVAWTEGPEIEMTDRQSNCPICAQGGPGVQRHRCGFPIARCAKCKSTFAVLTAQDLPSYDEHYQPDSIYEGYHSIAARAAQGGEPLYWYQHRMLEVAGPGHGRAHLDLGSGLGTFPSITRSRGWAAEGVDVSSVAAAQASKDLGIRTFVGDFLQYDRPAASVGWISAFEVLEHVLEPREYVSRFHDLLAPGGLVTVSVPNGASRDERYTNDPLQTPPTHVNFFSREGLNRLFSDFAFQVVYDYEKPFAWGELKVPKLVKYAMLPWLLVDGYVLGNRGNRLLWVGRKPA